MFVELFLEHPLDLYQDLYFRADALGNILLQDGCNLLLEDGDLILLE